MYHNHSHAHSHGHGECTHDHGHSYPHGNELGVEMGHTHADNSTTLPSIDSAEGSTKVYTVEEFMSVVRFGGKIHIDHLLNSNAALLNSQDTQGNTAMHWAAKRGDVEILQHLYDKGAKHNIAATSDANLLPIHWAAAEGKLEALGFFLNIGQDMNMQDSNGCTPAVIAVQFNQVNAVIYLAKHGADLTMVDNNGDHCLHWAAYKGYDEILELVLYFIPRELNKCDNFGQSALHLAAIRGNHSVVEILLNKYKADFMIRDKGGLTALDQAMKKNNTKTEYILRRRTASGYIDTVQKIFDAGRQKVKYMPWLMFCGYSEKDQGVWMWRLTCYSNLYATFASVQYALSPVMSDLSILHIVNTFLQVIWWMCFLSCLWRDPGFVTERNDDVAISDKKVALYKVDSSMKNDDSLRGLTSSDSLVNKSLYDEGLNIIAKLVPNPTNKEPNLCHTCRVQRPLRSKHCRISGHCVQKFDHFCPYVFNVVGRDNYKFFVGLLFVHPIAYAGFVASTVYYYYRAPMSYWYMAFLGYSALMCLMVLGLGQYHFYLLNSNLTTNEDINKMRYDYLVDELKRYSNPFDLGSTAKNIMDGVFPSKRVFYTREEVVKFRLQQG